eukprot:Hpha_TRINITY_DN34144_c0_g1::TRINITY_DN34144_c0_g1_i1::g.75787::m.75787
MVAGLPRCAFGALFVLLTSRPAEGGDVWSSISGSQTSSSGSGSGCSYLWPPKPTTDGCDSDGFSDTSMWGSSSDTSDSSGGSGVNVSSGWGKATGWCLRLAMRTVCRPPQDLDSRGFAHIIQHSCGRVDCAEIFKVRLPGLQTCPTIVQAAVLMSFNACYGAKCPGPGFPPVCAYGEPGPLSTCCNAEPLGIAWHSLTLALIGCSLCTCLWVLRRPTHRWMRGQRRRRQVTTRVVYTEVTGAALESRPFSCDARVFTEAEHAACLVECDGDSDAEPCDHTCPVCLERYAPGDDIGMSALCGHEFHKDCLQRSVAMMGRCPLCKGEVRSSACAPAETPEAPAEHPPPPLAGEAALT